LDHGKLPDPFNEAIRHVLGEQDKLAERLQRIEESLKLQQDTETSEKRSDDRGMAHG